MGLEKFNIKPDNKGGRPEGSTKDKSGVGGTREVEGRPLTKENGDTEWWLNVIKEVLDGDSIPESPFIARANAIEKISEYVYAQPITVRRILEEKGIIENDWDEYQRKFEESDEDVRIPGNISAEVNITSSSKDSSNADIGGLGSLIEKTK